MDINLIDAKWLDAIDRLYPIDAILPHHVLPDGNVDAYKTLVSIFALCGLNIGPDGRLADPYEHFQEPEEFNLTGAR